MLFYDNQEVSESLYKSEIIGKNQTYNFYSPAVGYNIKNLKGKNIIVIKSILNVENGRNVEKMNSIEYFNDFNGEDADALGLFNVYLKPFSVEKDALKVLEDIKLKHKI